MKIAAMSDIHLEFEQDPIGSEAWADLVRRRATIPNHPNVGPIVDNAVGVDLFILAGDIDIGTRGIDYAENVARYTGAHIIYVLGNHEAYNGVSLDQLYDQMRIAAAKTNGSVTFLENAASLLSDNGQRVYVLGATLWTDYEANGWTGVADAMRQANLQLDDHSKCTLYDKKFGPSDARDQHLASRAWLDNQITKIRFGEPNAKIIVVTHHAPILEANPPDFRDGDLAPAFVSDMHAEIEKWRPALWVFGHTHCDFDAMIGATRMLSRQRGDVRARPDAAEFRPAIIEI